MSTVDLIKRIKQTSKIITSEQRRQRLVDAHIIKENGQYDPKYFSNKTVKASKKIIAKMA
ncbi:hypothetical protein L5F39_00290 [Aliarcobacter butzleri]|uniref:hypothetical protein n=1 Tax=Aliarcobacter butzleri TaxID=28197 RepID=UPI001EDF7637|nr:hypothetical protein [Aliarcobacter butzleri]MCG3696033.1 hypothetical protein [Aliarcobacter butzleri]